MCDCKDKDSDNNASLQSDSSDEGDNQKPDTGENNFENDTHENLEEINIDDEFDDTEEINNSQEDTEAEAPVADAVVENDDTDKMHKTRSGRKVVPPKECSPSIEGNGHAESFAMIVEHVFTQCLLKSGNKNLVKKEPMPHTKKWGNCITTTHSNSFCLQTWTRRKKENIGISYFLEGKKR